MEIISVKAPSNCVSLGLIYDKPGSTKPFQTMYMKVVDRFVPNSSRVQVRSVDYLAGIKLIPLYFNYFDTISSTTNSGIVQHLRDMASTDGIWFFNVFIVATGVIPGQTVAGSRLPLEISSTNGIELPAGLFEIQLPITRP